MTAAYDFQRKPSPESDGELQPLYPHVVSRGIITTKHPVGDTSQTSSSTPGDIEGLLAAFEDRISHYLSGGRHVRLGNMGYFSAGLASHPVEDKKEVHARSIFFDKVYLRVSPGFHKQYAGFVEHVKARCGFRHSAEISDAGCCYRSLVSLEIHLFITRKSYSGLTGLLENKALNDLNLLTEKGYLTIVGQRSHKVYIKADNKEVTA